MALGLGFICGPVVGGILSDGNLVSWFNHTTPIIFAGILVVINTILVSLFFEETLTEPNPNKQVHILDCFRNIKKATQSTGVLKWIFLLVFLFFSAFTMFSQFIQVFLIEKFNFDAANIGYLFGYLGLWAIITQGFIIRILAKKYNPYQILNVAMIAQAVNYLLLLLPATKGDLYLLMPLFSIAQGLSLPNINATVSNSVSSNVQGETLGVQQSIQSFSQAIIPFIGGSLVSITYNAPFYTGALFMVLSWLVFKFKVLPYLQKRV